MTQIANTRLFDGVNDEINFTLGGLSGAWSGVTVMAIVKVDSSQSAADAGILYLADAVNLVYHPASVFFAFEVEDYDSYGNDPITANEWYVIGFTKAAGSSTARLHSYRYSTTTWSHTNGEGGALPDPGSPTAVIVANSNDVNFYKGLIACAGVWKASALSDGNVETLENDIANWEALSPTSLWLFDQTSAATAVEDRVGNSDQSSITGTTVTATADLAFDVGSQATTPGPIFRTGRGSAW